MICNDVSREKVCLNCARGNDAFVSTSLSDKNVDMAIFDSYSKTVMRNASRNKTAVMMKRRNNEIGGIKVMRYVMETYGKEDMYPSEFVVSDEHGHSCVITTEWLYQVMAKLQECQKEVLILEFWYGLSRKEVADLFGISETTISRWKRKAFDFIRDYYKRNIHNGWEKT